MSCPGKTTNTLKTMANGESGYYSDDVSTITGDNKNPGEGCSGNCWSTSGSARSDGNVTPGESIPKEDTVYEDHDDKWVEKMNAACADCATSSATACNDGCINGCANCNEQCGSQCTGRCSGECSACGGSCSSNCSGSCSGGCSNTCKGNCTGGCQGSCKTSCNIGCSNEEQLANITNLERIVRAPNIKKIFKFLAYEIEVRRKLNIPQEYTDNINKLTGWKKDQEDTLMYLYYNVPRIFENIFKDILKETSYIVQSGSLDARNNYKPFYPTADNINGPTVELLMNDLNEPQLYSLTRKQDSEKDIYYKDYSRDRIPPSAAPDYLNNNEKFQKYWEKYNPNSEKNNYYSKYKDKPNKDDNNNNSDDDSNNNDNNNTQSPTEQKNDKYYYYAYRPAAEIWVKKAHELYNELIKVNDAK